mgnify:CR=1 FL=1
MGDLPKPDRDLLIEDSVTENSLTGYDAGNSDFEVLWFPALVSSNYLDVFELSWERTSSSSADELLLDTTGLFFFDVLDSFYFNPAKNPLFFFGAYF